MRNILNINLLRHFFNKLYRILYSLYKILRDIVDYILAAEKLS